MNHYAIEEVLVELAAVAEEVIAAADAAEARMDELDEANEALIEHRVADGVPRSRPEPQHAIVSLRSTLATNAAREHREAAREFAAWWADVATLAVLAAVTGQLVHPARVAAADPTIGFDEEDLHHLPDVPERDRELTRLTAVMAATPLGEQQIDYKMAKRAREHAAHAGLRLDYADDGRVVVKEDWTPEARRRRLWGDAWNETRVPALPTPDELTSLLANHGAPTSTVAFVAEATHAIDDAVTALRRMDELERGETEDEPLSAENAETVEALWRQAEQLTALLARYARTLTDTLLALRAGDQAQ
ncbi:MAG TPA: hypothetical protein VGD71_34195 [Kribbella sp.]|jgi:hypothetical protein